MSAPAVTERVQRADMPIRGSAWSSDSSRRLMMARLRRATFALMLAILPATATVVGLLVLGQVPTAQDLVGITLVIVGVVLHQERHADTRQWHADRHIGADTPH